MVAATVGRSTVVAVFFFNDPATTEISALSLHDALPIFTVPAPPSTFAASATLPLVVVASVTPVPVTAVLTARLPLSVVIEVRPEPPPTTSVHVRTPVTTIDHIASSL